MTSNILGVAIHPERLPLAKQEVQPVPQLVQHLLMMNDVDRAGVIEPNPESDRDQQCLPAGIKNGISDIVRWQHAATKFQWYFFITGISH